MSDTVLIALIAAFPVVLGMIGKTASFIIKLVQDGAEKAIEAKNGEIAALQARIIILEGQITSLEKMNMG